MHKGPTIWPLDKDAFDVSDVDHAATDFPDLNFIVEHVGLPRIEDFCFMATQEPNVYAGLSVVIGGLMYARPKFFAKVMGELLFWVGEDKMTFGSDYGIWEPKWQVEGFVDWDYPDDEQFSDYPRVNVNTKKKILGLNAAKLYGIEVPGGVRARGRDRHAGGPGRREARRGRRCTGVTDSGEVLAALDAVRDPELDEPVTSLGFVASCTVSRGRCRERPAAAADVLLRPQLRLPHGRRRVRRRQRGRGRAAGRRGPGGPLRLGHDQRRRRAPAPGFVRSFEGEAVDELDSLRADFLRKAVLAGTDRVVPAAARGRRHDRRARRRSPWARCRRRPTGSGCAAGGPSSACPAGTTPRCWWTPRPARPSAPRCCRCTWRARA